MLLGVETSLLATFGFVWFESAFAELWMTVMVVGLLLTFAGAIQPAPGDSPKA
ncbi:hypothetical protein [Halorussus halobius]|uniref:hypothetical protein n=1 Tax=Halorussus halobius TaxID=1710537 RepID=UPI00143CC2A1|nr:hypothetical protein [Halorussus halobius]